MTIMLIEVDGHEADTQTYATTYLCGQRDGRDSILVRGLRYVDREIRTEGGWRVQRRNHVVDWMFDAPAALIAEKTFEV